jgi:hypothetical protein
MFENRADDPNCTIGEYTDVVYVASNVKKHYVLLLSSLFEIYDVSLWIFNIMSCPMHLVTVK